MTGVGAGSIGAAVLQGLLSGGAKVIVTTSRYSKEVTEYYQAIYAKYGASNSTLIVVPFNQGMFARILYSILSFYLQCYRFQARRGCSCRLHL